MVATRRDAAERWREALRAEARLRVRLPWAVAAIVATSSAISMVNLQYGVAAVLLLGVLLQVSMERMKERLRAAAESSRHALGWAAEDITPEEVMQRLDRFLEQR